MDLLELPDLRHMLVDIGTTLLCIGAPNGLPIYDIIIMSQT